MDKKPVLVLGIGNLLFRDDGVGLHVVERLKTMSLPSNVEIIEGGIAAFDIVYIIENRKKVIVIDAIKAEGEPGMIYRFNGNDFIEKRKNALKSPAEAEFTDYYNTTCIMGTAPEELIVIGIEPYDTGDKDGKLKIELSPVLQSKIPVIIDMVLKEINI